VFELSFTLAKAGALPLEPYLQSILLWLFGDGILQIIFLGWFGTMILLISASQVVRIIGVNHWHLAIVCLLMNNCGTTQDVT
jgi:4-amino-4-deoxy-L-arabinose transferase-like glycosyltransferase